MITGGNQSCLSRGCGDSRTRGGVRARDGSPRTSFCTPRGGRRARDGRARGTRFGG